MKAMNLLPSDSRAREMNIYQWLWCYHNIVEDQKEEQELFKDQLDRLAFIVNPEVAKKVFEFENKFKDKDKKKKEKVNNKKYEQKDLYSSDVFDKETRAAMLGYDPSSNQDIDEFLQKFEKAKKEEDILNKDIEDLFDDMQEVNERGRNTLVGDPDEEPEDFFERALQLEQQLSGKSTNNEDSENKVEDDDVDIFEVD